MSDSTKQERIEEFLRKSLLGEELVNTQFHLFSAKSSPSGRVLSPRVLCANNTLLAKSSNYFLDLLSSDINPSDSSLIDLTDDSDVPDHARLDDYGYASDSDLDECDDPAINAAMTEQHSVTVSLSADKIGSGAKSKDDDESDDESVSSDMFVLSPEQPKTDELFALTKDGPGSAASSETAVQEARANKTLENHAAIRLRSLGSRHVLVKDTAFQTWYTLLNYLYTDRFSFLPLGSTAPGGQPRESSTGSLDEPRCSAKSMYRLACKVGLNDLRDEAFSYIRSNLTEHNILKEISCSLVSKHQELLDMELDVLYTYISSPSVVANFSALAQRIANRELSHGAHIIVGIHTRLLQEPHLLPLRTVPPRSTLLNGVKEESDMKADILSESEESAAESSSVPRPGASFKFATPSSPASKPPIGPAPLPVSERIPSISSFPGIFGKPAMQVSAFGKELPNGGVGGRTPGSQSSGLKTSRATAKA